MSADGTTSLAPPRGMRDFFPEDMTPRNVLFDVWKKAAAQYGFSQYDACVVESLDLLKRKGGEEVTDQLYAFKDKSGRDLALRAEMTPTLARMIASRQGSLSLPAKWFAIAQCFRYERMTAGRKREHYQWNLDILGEESVIAEAEILAAAAKALSLMGLGHGDVTIRVSSRALLSELLARLGIDATFHPPVFLALDKRGKIGDEEIAATLRAAGLDAGKISAALDLTRIAGLRDALATLGEPTPGYQRLSRFFDTIRGYGLEDMVQFDISVVRGLGYYTGIVFEAFDSKRQFRAIFGGGRYDNLLNDIGGRPMTAVGLGFGDVVIAEYLDSLGKLNTTGQGRDIAIGFMEEAQADFAVIVAEMFRKQGRDVDMSLHSMKAKAFFSRAGQAGFRDAVFIGPDDVRDRKVRIKNMADRTEKEWLMAEGSVSV